MRAPDALASRAFDVVVIGGGIVGAAIARDAAFRGLATALVERADLGGGTSSGSSKLAHGGLRYLRQRHLRLVRESCRERAVLLRIAPGIVEPLEFLYPVYRRGARPGAFTPPWLLHAGLALYDRFAGAAGRRHRMLDAGGALAAEPLLAPDDLLGAALYEDASVDDARLVLGTARSAAARGALVATRVEAVGAERDARGRVRALAVRERESDRTIEVGTRVVVNAAGPWAGDVAGRLGVALPLRLRLTQGVHVVLPRAALPLERAVVMAAPDGRTTFAIPWLSVTLLATTDTDVASPDAARVRREDVAYLLAAARTAFPGRRLGVDDVQATTAAVRVLAEPPGGRRRSPSDVSREEAIVLDPSGVLTVAGGKLTSARAIAESAVDRTTRWLGSRSARRRADATAGEPLMGAGASAGAERGPDGAPTAAAVRHMAEHEWARSVADVLARRTRLLLTASDHGLAAAERIAETLGEVLGWDAGRRSEEKRAYAAEIARMMAWRDEPSSATAPAAPATARE